RGRDGHGLGGLRLSLLGEGDEPLEVLVQARQLAHERRHRRFVERLAHAGAEEVAAHAALSSLAASPRFLSPKKRKPFQREPAIWFAMAESVLYLRPSYSKPSTQTVTSWVLPSKTRRTTVPTGGTRGSRGSVVAVLSAASSFVAASLAAAGSLAGCPRRICQRSGSWSPSCWMRAMAPCERSPWKFASMRQARRFFRYARFRERVGSPYSSRYFSASAGTFIVSSAASWLGMSSSLRISARDLVVALFIVPPWFARAPCSRPSGMTASSPV